MPHDAKKCAMKRDYSFGSRASKRNGKVNLLKGKQPAVNDAPKLYHFPTRSSIAFISNSTSNDDVTVGDFKSIEQVIDKLSFNFSCSKLDQIKSRR
jgi:hypothetical protein